MLDFLVTSKARRRLLLLLWDEQVEGSVSHLAERADIGFASAQEELKAMLGAGLVHVRADGRRTVYRANLAHPQATALQALMQRPPLAPPEPADELTMEHLAAMGAPLRGVSHTPPDDRQAALWRGVALARRNPTVTRCLPLVVWNLRDELDAHVLTHAFILADDKHALGFFVELAGELGGDRRLGGLAEGLRDRRVTALRDFFLVAGSKRSTPRDFALATKWGFRMNLDLDAFRTLFEKFV